MLEATLNEILCVLNPLRNDVETRMRIIEELRNVVNSIESLKGMISRSMFRYFVCILLQLR